MPREQLRALAGDVDRLLAAGGSTAVGDGGLRKRAQALRALGTKVPVLAPIADAAERVARADARAAPRALLDLLPVVRQVQAGLATAGVAGPLEPVERSGPWTTAAPAREVAELAAAMTKPGAGLVETLNGAIRGHVLPDLRLVGPLLRILDQSSTMVALWVAQRALPTFGAAIVPELRRDLFGRDEPPRSDGFRLVALGKIDPGLGVEVARRVFAEADPAKRFGEPVVRDALEVLAEHARVEAEPVAIDLLARKPGPGLRFAAYEALEQSRSDAALDALIAGLLGDDQRWSHARGALASLPHPGATDRLVHELGAARARLQAGRALAASRAQVEAVGPAPKGKARAKGAPKGQSSRDAEVERLIRLLVAVKNRGDRRAAGALVPLLKDPAADVRAAAVEALTEIGAPEHLEAAAALMVDKACWKVAALAAWRLPPAGCYERLAPLCADLVAAKGAARDRAEFVLQLLERASEVAPEDGTPRTGFDPRWVDLLGPQLEGPRRDAVALPLAVVGGRAVVPRLLGALGPSLEKGEPNVAMALAYLKAPEAVPAMLDLAAQRPKTFESSCLALWVLCRPSDIPALEALLARSEEPWIQDRVPTLIAHARDSRVRPPCPANN